MKIYYAHPISIYNTPQERRDVAALEAMGFDIVNPNSVANEAAYRINGMAHFESLVTSCALLAFRAFPDGSIPAGVAKEIVMAGSRPIIELPSSVSKRTLSVDQTRQFLAESGTR